MYTVLNNLNQRKFFNAKSFINFVYSLFDDGSNLFRCTYSMKAKEIKWKGMEFRSKLEARYYNHFKNLDWDFDYEPDVPGLIGYQPDFVLYPSKKRSKRFGDKPIYVEIKPIRNVTEYWENPDYINFREKIKKYWNPQNDLILFGGALKTRSDTAAVALCLENTIYNHLTSYQFKYSYTEGWTRIGLSMFHT